MIAEVMAVQRMATSGPPCYPKGEGVYTNLILLLFLVRTIHRFIKSHRTAFSDVYLEGGASIIPYRGAVSRFGQKGYCPVIPGGAGLGRFSR